MFQMCMEILVQSIVDIMKNISHDCEADELSEKKTDFLDKLEVIMQSKLQKIKCAVTSIYVCR